jgi:acyl-CoA synthetase (AMP-forming)/AMP-acid ligase II
MGVVDLFQRGLSLYPTRTCLVDGDASRTYAEVDLRIRTIAAALRSAGLPADARVGLYSLNCMSAYEALISVHAAGLVYVPGNPRSHIDETSYFFELCGVSAVFYHSKYEQDVAELRRRLPELKLAICLDRVGGEGPWLEEWIAGIEPLKEAHRAGRNDLTAIYPTGGTTGRSKGVTFPGIVWDTMTANFFAMVPATKPINYLLVAPMTHAAGTWSLSLLAEGATVVIHDHFDAGKVLEAFEQHRITHTFLPPTAVYMLLAHPDIRRYDYSSLECFLYAAAPMSVEKLKQCLEIFGPVMVQCYGQTEAPMFATILTAADHAHALEHAPHRLASCGRRCLLTDLAIMDDSGNLLPPGERGEIVLRGDLVTPAYYRNDAATAEAQAFGWHHTGDIGVKDEDGFVYIVDRKKDMIITGGFNVFPTEIEQVVWAHPAVQDCAVVGAPDDKWGEAVTAVIEVKPGARLEPEELMAWCKERLGSIKTPKQVFIWDELPRTPVGKVSRKDVRAHFWQGRDRQI